jgi:quercetin dioxygenase-like cupin family protein
MTTQTKTEGAIKAGDGRYIFDLAKLATIDAGPGYSTAHGPVVEGERIQVGLIRMPRGTGARPHTHPNEQWMYVMQGTLDVEVRAAGRRGAGAPSSEASLEEVVDGVKTRVGPGSLVYIPAGAVHYAMATAEGDAVFLTAKDMSHGIVGTAVDTSISAPAYAPGFEPKR